MNNKPAFVVVSAVKKLVHDKGRRCSPDFLEALDAAVGALVRKACESHNGGAKTLDAAVLSAGVTVKAPSPESIRTAYEEASVMRLQMGVITKEEYQKRIKKIIASLETLL